MALESSERTPLLCDVQNAEAVPAMPIAQGGQTAPDLKDESEPWPRRFTALLRKYLRVDVENRILFAGFLITLSFSLTQVP